MPADNTINDLVEKTPLLILAGGKATRLKHLSVNTPKYLMPISDGKTFADVHLAWAYDQGFRKIILSVGYLGDQVQKYCGDGTKWGLEIEYIDDGLNPLGTGGAVRTALSSRFLSGQDSISHVSSKTSALCVTYGDTLLNFNAREFVKGFVGSQFQATMTIYKNEVPGHVCNIQWNRPLIIYNKVNPSPGWEYIDYGFLALKIDFIRQFSDEVPLDLAVPLSKASYQDLVSGFPVLERFWEIGSPEALEDFQARFRS